MAARDTSAGTCCFVCIECVWIILFCIASVCVYRRTTWGECDGASNMVSMVKTLKRGDPSLCEATQTVQRKCKRKKKQEGRNTRSFLQFIISLPGRAFNKKSVLIRPILLKKGYIQNK